MTVGFITFIGRCLFELCTSPMVWMLLITIIAILSHY